MAVGNRGAPHLRFARGQPLISDAAERPQGLWRFLLRGLFKHCPRCGRGALFERWTRMRESCPSCDLRYLEDRGDPWAFLLVIDRVAFIFPIVVALYFGLHLANPVGFVVFGVALGVVFLLTSPNRYGLSVALVYWARWRFGAARN